MAGGRTERSHLPPGRTTPFARTRPGSRATTLFRAPTGEAWGGVGRLPRGWSGPMRRAPPPRRCHHGALAQRLRGGLFWRAPPTVNVVAMDSPRGPRAPGDGQPGARVAGCPRTRPDTVLRWEGVYEEGVAGGDVPGSPCRVGALVTRSAPPSLVGLTAWRRETGTPGCGPTRHRLGPSASSASARTSGAAGAPSVEPAVARKQRWSSGRSLPSTRQPRPPGSRSPGEPQGSHPVEGGRQPPSRPATRSHTPHRPGPDRPRERPLGRLGDPHHRLGVGGGRPGARCSTTRPRVGKALSDRSLRRRRPSWTPRRRPPGSVTRTSFGPPVSAAASPDAALAAVGRRRLPVPVAPPGP